MITASGERWANFLVMEIEKCSHVFVIPTDGDKDTMFAFINGVYCSLFYRVRKSHSKATILKTKAISNEGNIYIKAIIETNED